VLVVQLLFNGLQLGSFYALTAAGFALIFGSTRVFHVAHGACFVLCGYVFFYIYEVNGGAWWLATIASVCSAAIFGICIEKFVYRPIQRHEASFFTVFIASFGVAIVVQNAVSIPFGRGFVSVSSSLSRASEVIPGLYIAPVGILAIAIAAAIFVALHLFLKSSMTGIGLRALSENVDLVRSYGLNPVRLARWAFVLGSMMTVAPAILTAIHTGLHPSMGPHVMLISLAASIVGGIGNMRGAALAGLMLGLIENLVVWRLDTQWAEAASFVALFFVILFWPSGLLGQAKAR
jgi:branched-chain amino acid transport system permease protein